MGTYEKQRGITFLGLLVVASLVAMIAMVAIQVFPTVVEYWAVQKAVQKAAEGETVAEVRSIFDKAAAVEDIGSLSGADLQISKSGNRVVVAFAYTRELHLVGPAYLLMKYEGQSQ